MTKNLIDRLNTSLAQLPVYQPGRPIEEVARELGMAPEGIIKLASNENPSGPSPKAVQAMHKAADQMHLYPDGNAFYLKARLARHLGVQPTNLIIGNGSNEILEFLGHAFLREGLEAIVSQYCFAVYPIVTHLFGGRLVVVPAKNLGHDLSGMLRAVTANTSVVFIGNPNNPTGTLVSEDDLVRLIEEMPPHVLVVVDEAYIEFLDKPIDLIPAVRDGRFPNVLLVRTFSKIYGLAGLRVGYGIGQADLVTAFEKIRQPFNSSAMAQAAALAALEDGEHVERTKRLNRDGLKQLALGFGKLGLDFVPSCANFILLRVGDGQKVFAGLQSKGIIVRPMGGYGLGDYIRITVGTSLENERCLKSLSEVISAG
jgi:histidinol-phosphate aminotransferase